MCDEQDKDLRTERAGAFSGALFLFGLALLFHFHIIWPWILVLIFLTAVPILIVEEGWMGVWVLAQAALWLGGIALLIKLGGVFPGVLVLAGLSALLVAIFPPDRLEAREKERETARKAFIQAKRKRDVPLPHMAERLADEDAVSAQDGPQAYEWSDNGHKTEPFPYNESDSAAQQGR